MRLHGYCETCHRIKLVRVRVPRPGAMQLGTCSACEEKAEAASRERRDPRRRPR